MSQEPKSSFGPAHVAGGMNDAIAAFDRRNAEMADWRKIEVRALPAVKDMSTYRVRVAEGMNNAQVYLWEQGAANPSPAVVLESHRQTFENATHDAGHYRQVGHPVTFGGRQGAEPQRIKIEQARLHAEMSDLLAQARTPQDHCAAIAFYHARFVGIHPFMDGNGRIGRAIMSSQANLLGMKLKLSHLAENKKGYIEALGQAFDSNNIAPLAKVIADSAGVEWTHQGELISDTKIKSRPMLTLDDIKPLDEERAMAKTGIPYSPLPTARSPEARMGGSEYSR